MAEVIDRQSTNHQDLKNGEIHIWTKKLNPEPYSIESLSDDERKRAKNFRLEPVRDQFVRARIALREILSKYLVVDPRAVSFTYNRFGKPFLRPTSDRKPLYFNLSHSGNRVLIGLARGQEIGVDLESKVEKSYGFKEAGVFCSDGEMRVMKALPKLAVTDAFFNLWTRKEACVKAMGEGLSAPLRNISFNCGDCPNEFDWCEDAIYEFRDWSVKMLPTEPNFSAAVAVKGEIGKISCFELG